MVCLSKKTVFSSNYAFLFMQQPQHRSACLVEHISWPALVIHSRSWNSNYQCCDSGERNCPPKKKRQPSIVHLFRLTESHVTLFEATRKIQTTIVNNDFLSVFYYFVVWMMRQRVAISRWFLWWNVGVCEREENGFRLRERGDCVRRTNLRVAVEFVRCGCFGNKLG